MLHTGARSLLDATHWGKKSEMLDVKRRKYSYALTSSVCHKAFYLCRDFGKKQLFTI